MIIMTIESQSADELARKVFAAQGLLSAGTAWVPLPDGRASRQTRYQVGPVRVVDIECGNQHWTELHGQDRATVLTAAQRLFLDPDQCREKPLSGALTSPASTARTSQ